MCSSKSGNVIAHCGQRDPRAHGIEYRGKRENNIESKYIKRNSEDGEKTKRWR